MELLTLPSALPEQGVRATRFAPVIIATDGQPQSDGALVVGRLFAQSVEAFRVVSVLRTVPVIPEAPLGLSAELDESRREAVRREIAGQMIRAWDDEGDVELRDGDPALVISRIAHRANATMIVAGLGRHRASDRLFSGETALRLVRLADVPVFAAAANLTHAPRRIVVAVDFSETSLRAAKMALDVAGDAATIYLAHVAPRDSGVTGWKRWGAAYKEDAGGALKKVRDQLCVPADMTVQNVLLQGDTATEILAFATSVNADLIATGSHGHGFVARMLIGSVATRIVRCSTCSVLTVPHAAAMTRVRTTSEPPTITPLPTSTWISDLDDFTKRNFGRRGVLEVDDPEIGAQAQEFDYPLLGAFYDAHVQRLELMFGQSGNAGLHLCRGIGDVKAIDVLRDDTGRDIAIRVSHGTGQTLLTFAA